LQVFTHVFICKNNNADYPERFSDADIAGRTINDWLAVTACQPIADVKHNFRV